MEVAGEGVGVIGFGAGEGAEGVKGLHNQVVEDFGVLLRRGTGEDIVALQEVAAFFLFVAVIGALRGLIFEINI